MEMTILDEVDTPEPVFTIDNFIDDEGGISGVAKNVVGFFREKLIGQIFITESMGDYTGGKAEVLEVFPEDDNDGICMNVRQCSTGRFMGVFNNESIFSFHQYSDWDKNVDMLVKSVQLITDSMKEGFQ